MVYKIYRAKNDVVTGTMEAREIVAGLKNNLERLTGWHD